MTDPVAQLHRQLLGRVSVPDREVQVLLDVTKLVAQRTMKAMAARGIGRVAWTSSGLTVTPLATS
jgi:hypothetical protein